MNLIELKLQFTLDHLNVLDIYLTMFINLCLKVLPQIINKTLKEKKLLLNNLKYINSRSITISANLRCDEEQKKSRALVTQSNFENIANKNKVSYLDMVDIFKGRDIHRRGHVEFIYSALKYMEEFGVHKDLEVYKSLINVLPKGKFIPTNVFQAEFMHYPKQQQCIIDLLQQMEDNGVIPDFETEDILLNIFGRRGYPLRKYWRMMYWMPKFKNLSPFPLPSELPQDSLMLAKLAITRIMSVDLQSEISVYKSSDIEDSVDDTFIVNGQSPKQKELLEKHDKALPVYVEGAFRIWLKNVSVNYFVLKTDPKTPVEVEEQDPDDVSSLQVPFFGTIAPKSEVVILPSVHEQSEGIIFAVCATGTSSRDSLLSWIRHLEKQGNPVLGEIAVVFKLKSPPKDEELKAIEMDPQKQIDNKK